MLCQQCGYAMDAFQHECPRCRWLRNAAKQSPFPTSRFQHPPSMSVPQWGIPLVVVGSLFIGFLLFLLGRTSAPQTTTAPPVTTEVPRGELPVTPRSVLSNPPTARAIAQIAFPSLVYIQANDGDVTVVGSGFFVADGVVATNAHVINGMTNVTVKIVGQEKYLPMKRVINYNYTVAVGNDGVPAGDDLALIEVEKGSALSLSLGNMNQVAIGDTVYAVGNPEALEGTFSSGIVSALRRYEQRTSRIQITAPISSGSSGGPLLDAYGRVIGIVVESRVEGQNLNLAIPVSDLQRLMTYEMPRQ